MEWGLMSLDGEIQENIAYLMNWGGAAATGISQGIFTLRQI